MSSLNPKNYLFFKIFIWFWLTIVATVGLLIFLSQITLSDVEHQTLTGPKLKNLQHTAQNIERLSQRKKELTIEKIARHPRVKRHRLLYFKSSDPQLSFFNKTKHPEIDPSLLNFSIDLAPQAIFTEKFHAFGPIKVSHQQGDYLMYEVRAGNKNTLLFKLKRMPSWLKLSISLLVSLLLSLLFSRLFIRPINQLKTAAKALAQGQLTTRVDANHNRHDEFGQLTQDFNQMAENLERLMTSQKRLLANVSHELRTPLTRLQMAAGLAQIPDETNQQAHIERIEKEANTLDKMIHDVLKLSRLEANNQAIHNELQPFALVWQQVLSDAKFEAKQHQKTLTVIGEQDAVLNYDGQLLASALENVLRNAIRYAKTQIKVAIEQTSEQLVITIADDGPGVDEAELAHLFEPFYRVSNARERHSGGTGLGLSICKHAIIAHKGSIELRNQTNSGLLVQINLPL